MEVLAAQFPESPEAERARFLAKAGGDLAKANTQLAAYLKFREEKLPMVEKLSLPPWCFWFGKEQQAKDGTPIIFAQPARIDSTKGNAEEWAIASAGFIESCVSREDDMKITLLCDLSSIDPAHGGVNEAAHNMLNVIRQLSNVLMANYPGRLQRVVLYPLPYAVKLIWDTTVAALLDPAFVQAAVLLTGDDIGEGRVPSALDQYVALDALQANPSAKATMFDVPKPPPAESLMSSLPSLKGMPSLSSMGSFLSARS